MVVAIIFVVILLCSVFLLLWASRGARIMKKAVKEDSAIVYGAKGKGKSLLFQYLAYKAEKKEGYISNVDYGYKRKVIKLSDLDISPNVYDSALNDEWFKLKKKPFENKLVLLDDCAVYLPNFADCQLKKKYPSLPLSFAIWRHLYNAPIWLNAQTLERTWKPLREQASIFIRCRGVIRLPFFVVVRFTYYDNEESASVNLSPFKTSIFNKYSKGERDTFNATHGTITNAFIIVRKSKIRFDSRYFHKKVFGRKSPTSR